MKRILTFAMMLLFTVAVFAQNNDKISYQAVVRTSDNVLVYDQDLTVIIAIANVEGDETGVYGEQHNVHSNANGLISLMIGTGTNKTGNWNAIEWNHAWVTATIKKGSEQLAKHHVPMSAVPYALYAEKVNCDAVNACVGNGKLTITDGTNDNKKEYTANQTGDQTVTLGKAAFTNNYNDLINKPTIPSAANDGVLTITDGTTTNTKTFTADQATNTTVTLGKAAFTNNYNDLTNTPTISDKTITIKNAAGSTVGTFTLNQTTDGTVTLPAPNNGKITIKDADGNTIGDFTVDQADNKTIYLPDNTFPRQKSAKFTATAGQYEFTIPNTIVSSPWTIDYENYVVQMYINGVYVGDQNDNVVSVSGKKITYDPDNNGSYTLMAGDRVQFVFWLTKMLYY